MASSSLPWPWRFHSSLPFIHRGRRRGCFRRRPCAMSRKDRVLLSLLCFLCCCFSQGTARQSTVASVHTALNEKQFAIDPIMTVENGIFSRVPSGCNENAATRSFWSMHFHPGKKYNVFFGGELIGSASVVGPDRKYGDTIVKVGTQKNFDKINGTLATDFTIPSRKSYRRS